MIAKPPNCAIVPNQRNGTRRQPSTERWWSERKPTSVRKGAESSGSASMSATIQEGTPSSTIITRFSVPIISTAAMPTVTWNSDSRSRLPERQLLRRGVREGQELRPDPHSASHEGGAGAVHDLSASMACEM